MIVQVAIAFHEVQIWSEMRFIDMSVLDGVKTGRMFPYFVSNLFLGALDPHFTEVSYENSFTDANPNTYELVN